MPALALIAIPGVGIGHTATATAAFVLRARIHRFLKNNKKKNSHKLPYTSFISYTIAYLLNVRCFIHEILLIILLTLTGLTLEQGASWRYLLLSLRIAKVDQLVVDPHLLHATLETGQIAYLPILVGLLGRLHGQTAQEHGCCELEIIIRSLIDDGACQATIDTQREVFLDGQQLDSMILAIGNHLEAIHGRHRVIAHIVADTNATIEQFHSQMCILAIVHKDAVLFGTAKDNGYICLGPRTQRFQFHKGIVVDEADAGQILAPLARIARMTLAQIVRAGGIGLEAYTMFALMVLARRCLWIHHGDHVVALTVLARKVIGALAEVIIDAIHTAASILAHMILAIVNVVRAVDAMEAGHAVAAIVGEVIQTLGPIGAGIELLTAELYLRVAPLAREARLAFTAIRLHTIDAGGIVLTAYILAQAIIDVRLTACTRIAWRTLAAEATLLEHGAGGIVAARIAIAGIDHVLAVLAMVAGLAEALILTLWQCQALCLVLAGLLVAGVALGQDLVAHTAAAGEVRRGSRQDQLILHILRLGTACNARLHIVQLDPVREPFQRAVTVQGIAAKCTKDGQIGRQQGSKGARRQQVIQQGRQVSVTRVTHMCVNDLRSSKDPSGSIEMRLPCSESTRRLFNPDNA